MAILCPKCGYTSGDGDMCEACGVIFARARMHEHEIEEALAGPHAAPVDDRPRYTLTKVFLILGLVAAALIGYRTYFGELTLQQLEREALLPADLDVSADLILLQFTAPWSGPWLGYASTINSVEEAYESKLAVYRLNIDENPDLARRLNVRTVPTSVFFASSGQLRRTVKGVLPEATLKEMIDDML